MKCNRLYVLHLLRRLQSDSHTFPFLTERIGSVKKCRGGVEVSGWNRIHERRNHYTYYRVRGCMVDETYIQVMKPNP